LYIYDKWDFNKKYIVVRFDWNKTIKTEEDLEKEITRMIKENADRL